MLGLTSITFRRLSRGEIIALAARAGLEGIEWGGDVHVPPGDAAVAEETRRLTESAGLAVLSYGSYYRLNEGSAFGPVLNSALSLGAPMIRVWAGKRASADADETYVQSAAGELAQICEKAARHHVRIGLEYHRNTLTDTRTSAQRLIRLAGADNLTTYWQPNPDLSMDERLLEIESLLPRISNIHVFNWGAGNERRPLAEGADAWKRYIQALGGNPRHYIMEFVPDDDPDAFLRDARALRGFF